MNKYTNVVTEINPMETAPVWGYYNGKYDRVNECWREHYSGEELYEVDLLGWLPAHNISEE